LFCIESRYVANLIGVNLIDFCCLLFASYIRM